MGHRMSDADYVRRVATLGTRQPFYEALRLREAADRLDQLEFENARLKQAMGDVTEFFRQKGVMFEQLLASDDAIALALMNNMFQSVHAAMQRPVELPQPEVSGEYDPRTGVGSVDEAPSLEERTASPFGWRATTYETNDATKGAEDEQDP